MKKLFVSAAIVASVMMGVNGNALAAGEKLVLSVPSLATPYEVTMRQAGLDYAKKIGVNLQALDGQNNSPKQVADLENAMTAGAQGFIISPNDEGAVAPAVDELVEGGRVVVTIDRSTNSKHKVPHFGTDPYQGGVVSAEFIKKQFPNGAEIFLLTGQPGASSNIQRLKGIHDSLKQNGDKYPIVVEQTGNWMRSEGLRIVQSIWPGMKKKPQVIFGMNDDMALGAIEALQTMGYKPGEIMVMGFNAGAEALARVRDGWMAVTYDLQQGYMVQKAMDQILANLRDKTPVEGMIVQPLAITKDNLKDATEFDAIDNY
ncbi:substrate-binding domain-containing protein [Bartonella sp. DGB2]|uniref:substrate-binding domain-containing protein n=1 Tax=Bartonella sp. DGB2 TaxID=3388426 RepID=UPI00398FC3B0